jgi:hypothetical protein
VSRPSEDVCKYCYAFRNVYKSLCRTTTAAAPPPMDDDPHDDDDECNTTKNSETVSSVAAADVDPITEEREQKIEAAALHVRAARAQRELVNKKIELARGSRDLPHQDRIYTLIVDYGQNMELPYFGHEQPGDTYYFCPLTIYNLGVVDVSHADGDHLYCHIYMEGEGKKGGNNVSSLLLKTLRLLNFMQEGGNQGKELNVVFDNCGGQNKNNFVLLLVPYLVEMGYFKSVNFIFLVVGHTKNAADRLFNLLKMIYRRSNVQTFGSLLGVCGKSPHVTPIAVVDGDFQDYSIFLLEFYNTIKDIREQHIFSCSVQSDGSIYNPLKQLLLTVRKSDLDEHVAVSKNCIKKTFPSMNDEEYDADPIAA